MRRSKFPNPVHMSCIMPVGLKRRLVRRAAKETDDNGIRVTPSDIMRDAIEEYLDLYEGATFVPARAARQRALARRPTRCRSKGA
jgi:hypothetical protein